MMRLVWYQRQDGLWNAACACNATICGVELECRAAAETAHFKLALMRRELRGATPERLASDQIPPCAPKLPEPNPNLPTPWVFP